MATLKLNKNKSADAKSADGPDKGPRRAPLRGQGVNKPRPTLAKAQAERAEREAAFQQRRAEEGRQERRDPRGDDRHRDARGPQGRDERRGGPGRPQREGGYGDRADRGPREDRGGFGGRPDRGGDERRPHGDRPQGDRARYGDRPQGDRPRYDDRSQGDRSRFEGDRPRRDDRGDGRYGDHPARPQGDRGYGDRSHGDRGFGERGHGERGYGDRPQGPRAFGERPQGDRPQRDRPFGDRPAGDRGYGDRPRRDERGGDRGGDRYGRGAEGSRYGSGPGANPGFRHGEDRPRRAPAGDRGAAHPGDVHARAEREERAERTDRPRQPDAPRQPAPVRLADPDAGERLSKRMSELGLASRREADEWIEAGWVTVDGEPATLGQRVGPDAKIEVDPAAREQQAQRVTILLHKPIGYVSGQAEDGYEPASVLVKADTHWGEDPAKIHWAPGHGRNLAPAGRLDIDSTGLLVLTQDGRIARHLIGEDSDVEKEYLVRVALEHGDAGQHPQHQLDPKAIALLNHGLELDGVQLKPAKVSWANEDQLRFVLREGRKRQIRRMCELVGLKVLALKRVRIGRIPLGQLPPGQWRYLAPWERF
ncbi:pseudouridine synthase [Mitsuaria sp. BK037]|uniref:pseudouridine synthase n=1 Tax=Mitsuaria sp. BK037 TaxID=2587122 RepID=UPI00161E19BB|nr:pseudouridine synthase [Mitsuaria sp. BK037]MBB3280767.1 23S rRNA pseudouridine2604 synthase [Mitsuaria sp. BK037]